MFHSATNSIIISIFLQEAPYFFKIDSPPGPRFSAGRDRADLAVALRRGRRGGRVRVRVERVRPPAPIQAASGEW